MILFFGSSKEAENYAREKNLRLHDIRLATRTDVLDGVREHVDIVMSSGYIPLSEHDIRHLLRQANVINQTRGGPQ